MYTDSSSGIICHSSTLMASSCFDGSCNHTFDVLASSNCPSLANISVTAFATNILGDGRNSTTVQIG